MANKTRKIPMRMCVGCRERREKKELRRVVRTPEGNVVVDLTGKLSGRGAYICKDNVKCLEKAVKSKALERHLETQISDEVFDSLKKEFSEGD
jgi:predicted RNA-binding protein YlxR (DUF448 family)